MIIKVTGHKGFIGSNLFNHLDMIPNFSATSQRIIIKVRKKTIPKNCENDFE